jgi:hypothetical protein
VVHQEGDGLKHITYFEVYHEEIFYLQRELSHGSKKSFDVFPRLPRDLWEVTDRVSCSSLMDWKGCEAVPGNSPHVIDRAAPRQL